MNVVCQEENDKMLAELDDDREDLDALFAELDASVAQSRAVSCCPC